MMTQTELHTKRHTKELRRRSMRGARQRHLRHMANLEGKHRTREAEQIREAQDQAAKREIARLQAAREKNKPGLFRRMFNRALGRGR